MSRLNTLLAAAAITVIAARPASSQQSDTAELRVREQAQASIRTVRVTPAIVRVGVGDTVEVTVVALDAGGRAVTVALPNGTTAQPRIFLHSPGASTEEIGAAAGGGQRYRVIGVRGSIVGQGASVRVLRPPFPTGPTSEPQLDDFPFSLVVAGRATEKVRIADTKFGFYVGTSIQLESEVRLRGSKYPETGSAVSWTSSNNGIASVSDSGLVTFFKSGKVNITAQHGGVRDTKPMTVLRSNAQRVVLSLGNATVIRTGDVVRLKTEVWGTANYKITDAHVNYAIGAPGGQTNRGAGAQVFDDGSFVAERPGSYTIVAEVDGASDRQSVQVRPRAVRQNARLVSHTPLPNFGTSEIVVFEGADGRDYAYLGTWGNGDRVYVYDVTNAATPRLLDSVMVDARVINDIRIDRDKAPRIAVFTREGASDRKNGIVILDVSNPGHPVKLSDFTENVAGGVHDVWIYKNRVYLTSDGTGDMHIVDISDPKNPKESGRWSVGTPGRYIHDLIFVDDVGYMSYWDDGMIILDVGGAGKGGSLDRPVFVSQYKYGPFGSTHHVFRYKNYAFISDELFGTEENGAHANGPGGYVHVVDVSDLENPREVARYEVPEAGAHNTWAENDRLYVAHYQGGLRVVDISGELRGDLYRQGREIAWFNTAGGEGKAQTPNQAMAWSPQPYKGNIFVSDLNSGMWVIRLQPKAGLVP